MNLVRTRLAGLAAGISLLACAPLASQAATGFQGLAKITGIDVGNTEMLILRLSAPNTCGSNLVQVPRTASYYKDMLALATVSYANEQEVNVWVDSCSGQVGNIVRMINGVVW